MESKWLSLYIAIGVIALLIVYIYHLLKDGRQEISVAGIIICLVLCTVYPILFLAFLAEKMEDCMSDEEHVARYENRKPRLWHRILTKTFKL